MVEQKSMVESSKLYEQEKMEMSGVNTLLEKFEIRHLKDMVCETGNSITRICTN